MKKICVIIAIVCIGALAWCFTYGQQEDAEMFDTTVIEQSWCNGLDYGTVRMVGAWWYDDHVVEDETGNLWNIEQDVAEGDFLLLWITDNFTADDVKDDVIVKVWREAY